MSNASVVPTGEIRTVGIDELFFSVTDHRGIIEQANSVFSRLACYPRWELIGAPHNIIRHPQMPSGVFRLLWDTLGEGRPMAGYIKNLAGDGKTYWVFATITPVQDKYLSVRSAPCVRPLWQAADSLYEELLRFEAQAARSGYSRVQVAELAAGVLQEKVAGLGFANYDAFINAALPAEVAARAAASSQARHRPHVTGDLGNLLAAADRINAELSALLARLDGLQELADALARASRDALAAIDGLRQATEMAVRASQSVAANAPVLGRSANAMVVRAGQASQTITGMAGELQRVRRGILELRFGIGLCRLHNDMVTSFINEVAAGQAPPEGLSYVPLLCRALHRDVVSLTSDMANSSRVLRSASEQIEQANEQLREFQRGMATWRLLVPRYRMSRQLDPYVAPIDRQLNEGHTQMAGLRQIASRCSAEAQPFDPGEMNWAIDQIRQVSARFPAASPA